MKPKQGINVQALQDRVTGLEDLLKGFVQSNEASHRFDGSGLSKTSEAEPNPSRETLEGTRTRQANASAAANRAADHRAPSFTDPSRNHRDGSYYAVSHSTGLQNANVINFVASAVSTQNAHMLPPPAQAWVLLQEYLVDFNRASPLFAEDFLTGLYRSVFMHHQDVESIPLAAVYVTLAIAHRLRRMSPLGSSADDGYAQVFLQQTLAALPEMLLRRPTLLSCQCLIGMAVVIHGTSEPYPASGLLTLALRMMLGIMDKSLQCADEHRPGEQLTRTFWIAVSMDADMSIRIGQWLPPTFNGLGMALPSMNLSDGAGLISFGRHAFEVFYFQAQLAQIQVRLLQVLAMRPHVNSDVRKNGNAALTDPVRAITEDLTAWRLRESLFQTSPSQLFHDLHRSDRVHVLVLEARYFITLFMLQSFRVGVGPFCGSVLAHLGKYNKLVFSEYVEEARRLVDMFNHLPQGNFAAVWLVLEAVATAVYVLLCSIIEEHTRPTIKEDLELVESPLRLLGELSPSDTRGRVSNALNVIRPLYNAAQTAQSQQNNMLPASRRRG